MNNNRFMSSSNDQATQIDLGLRSYMLGVYNYNVILYKFQSNSFTKINIHKECMGRSLLICDFLIFLVSDFN